MQTIATQLTHARAALSAVAGDVAALEARLLAAHAWGMTTEALVKDADQPRDHVALQHLLDRRLAYEPLSQIIGEKDFWKDSFRVTRDVLTPRADSETIIETLLRLRPNTSARLRLLDLGTGSGCLLLSALREYAQAHGTGVDQSQAALAVASHNAHALKLADRVRLLRSNWCSALDGMFDVILANPPYIPLADIATLAADVRDHEPHAALDGGADGLDCYRSILGQIAPFAAPHALLLFEVGMGQAEDVAALGRAAGFTLLDIIPDLAGIARVVALEITTTTES
ncbi:MAG: peptide chain release factor N(5)-glutamine methyltransferase [Pseudomonadota bacterium]